MGKKDRIKNGLASLFEDNSDIGEQTENRPSDNNSEETKPADRGEENPSGRMLNVRISLIEPDRDQPRKLFDEEKLSELADNILEVGVLQPLIVRPAKVPGRYTIIAGERRWRAARMAGLSEVPVIVRDMTKAQSAQIALIENLQREDITPLEEARAYERLKTKYSMTQETIAKAVGKSRPSVANSLRLLELEPECIEALERGEITAGHAKALLSAKERDLQLSMLEIALRDKISVRELEKLAEDKSSLRKAAGKTAPAPAKTRFDKECEEYRLSMRDTFGLDARFKRSAGGKMTMKVSFTDEAELKEFLKRLSDK